MDEGSEELIPTRKSLLGRLKRWDDQESWRDFFDTYWKLIYNFALKHGLTHSEAEEIVQETVLAVAKSIGSFEYEPAKCAFKTWLLTVTQSKLANHFARQQRRPALGSAPIHERTRTDTGTPALERIADTQSADADAVWDADWEKNLMEAAIQRVKRRVSIEQFQMFDLFALKEWPAKDVAKTLHVSIAHVYVAKHRIAKLIRREVETLRAKPI